MRTLTHMALMLALAVLPAGCGDGGAAGRIEAERQARAEAQRREEAAVRQARTETERRERWQSAAWAGALLAVVLLVAGTALGSRSRDAGPPQ